MYLLALFLSFNSEFIHNWKAIIYKEENRANLLVLIHYQHPDISDFLLDFLE